MPKTPHHVPRWDDKRNLTKSKPWEHLDDIQSTKKIVKKVITPAIFETQDNHRIRIDGVNPPSFGKKGYLAALNSLKSVLRENAAVTVIPKKRNQTGDILAKVEINHNDVRNIMKAKLATLNQESLEQDKKKNKVRWHQKYLKKS